jgi:glycosyltransferase involved in cell wall biosynthesis
MSLTLRDHTMLRGAWEATYQGTPVVVSDWPVLRQAFDEGAVHVDNTGAGIARGIRKIQRDPEAYRKGARSLMMRKEARWNATREALRALLRA